MMKTSFVKKYLSAIKLFESTHPGLSSVDNFSDEWKALDEEERENAAFDLFIITQQLKGELAKEEASLMLRSSGDERSTSQSTPSKRVQNLHDALADSKSPGIESSLSDDEFKSPGGSAKTGGDFTGNFLLPTVGPRDDAPVVDEKDSLDTSTTNTASASELPLIRSPRSANVETFGEAMARNNDSDDDYGMINQYVILDEVGRGTAGKVLLGLDTAAEDQEPVAIKVLPSAPLRRRRLGATASAEQSVEQEIAVMKRLRHENIVALHEVIDDPGNEEIFLVMDYVTGGPVTQLHEGPDGELCCDKIRPFKRLLDIAKQCCEGLRYLHRKKVVHNDIKPDNILVDKHEHVFLCDFGVSLLKQRDSGEGSASPFGTPAFFSPEVSRGDTPTLASDIWSLGITFFALTYGKLPFGRLRDGTFSDVQRDELEFPEGDEDLQIPQSWQILLQRMLAKVGKNRPTARELLQMPVFVENGFVVDLALSLSGDSSFVNALLNKEQIHTPSPPSIAIARRETLVPGSGQFPKPSSSKAVEALKELSLKKDSPHRKPTTDFCVAGGS